MFTEVMPGALSLLFAPTDRTTRTLAMLASGRWAAGA